MQIEKKKRKNAETTGSGRENSRGGNEERSPFPSRGRIQTKVGSEKGKMGPEHAWERKKSVPKSETQKKRIKKSWRT